MKLLGGILVSLRPSVRLSVRPSRMRCPLYNIYSSGWILSILGTNDHYHERVCRATWPLTLTYIFKVIRPWLKKSCPLCSIYSSGWIFLYLAQMITIIRGCVACYDFFRIWKFEFLKFFVLNLEKKSTILDRFFSYLAQMITSMRGSVTYNDLWPWPISSRSFGLGLENHVRSVASPLLNGFFPYLVQMIHSMRGCVACDDPWPWPISSRSFGLDLGNRIRSVASTVLDGLFLYMAQTITIIRGCVACYVFQNLKIWIFGNFFLIFRLWPWKKKSTGTNYHYH